MYAIVLTYDDNHNIANHMIYKYTNLWPNHPFIFRIPYQRNRSLINSTNNVPRVFNQLTTIINSIAYNLSDLPNFFEKALNNYFESGVYSEPCEDTSNTNNEITREMLEKAKMKTITRKFCKHCGVEVSTTGICSGFNWPE